MVDIVLQKIDMEIFSRAKMEDAILGRWAVLGRRPLGVKWRWQLATLCTTQSGRLASISAPQDTHEPSPDKVR